MGAGDTLLSIVSALEGSCFSQAGPGCHQLPWHTFDKERCCPSGTMPLSLDGQSRGGGGVLGEEARLWGPEAWSSGGSAAGCDTLSRSLDPLCSVSFNHVMTTVAT